MRFQAEQSNALWHFDMSPSDLKQLPTPPWIDPDRSGAPTLMLFSLVDDRSGVAYQEYRCVYGEDVEAALRFLFAAMARKTDEADPSLKDTRASPRLSRKRTMVALAGRATRATCSETHPTWPKKYNSALPVSRLVL